MMGRQSILLFGSGLAAGLLAAVFLAGSTGPAAQAQVPPAAAVGRYQLSAFSSASSNGSERGAYILDTQTGDLCVVTSLYPEPLAVGSAAKPRKPDRPAHGE